MKNKIFNIAMALLLIISFSTPAFASENNVEEGNVVINEVFNSIDSSEKKELIEKLYEPIYVVVEENCMEEMEENKKVTVDRIEWLASLSVKDLEEILNEEMQGLINELQDKNAKGYFLDTGETLIKELYPAQANSIIARNKEKKEEVDIYQKNQITKLIAKNEDLAKAVTRTRTNTVGYTCAEGRAYSITVKITWTSKNNKITSKSSSATTWNNGLWTRKSLSRTINTIDYRGFGHIVWKARFQHKVGMPVINSIRNGAWFYADGGCDWHY